MANIWLVMPVALSIYLMFIAAVSTRNSIAVGLLSWLLISQSDLFRGLPIASFLIIGIGIIGQAWLVAKLARPGRSAAVMLGANVVLASCVFAAVEVNHMISEGSPVSVALAGALSPAIMLSPLIAATTIYVLWDRIDLKRRRALGH
jgi:hypothetical protein